jgi:hypothetical protein
MWRTRYGLRGTAWRETGCGERDESGERRRRGAGRRIRGRERERRRGGAKEGKRGPRRKPRAVHGFSTEERVTRSP